MFLHYNVLPAPIAGVPPMSAIDPTLSIVIAFYHRAKSLDPVLPPVVYLDSVNDAEEKKEA